MDMSLGERSILTISSDYAYGDIGDRNCGIPPDCDLCYDIELLDIAESAAELVLEPGDLVYALWSEKKRGDNQMHPAKVVKINKNRGIALVSYTNNCSLP